ncbi:hypothetical protein EKH55_2964 [Sinorhizobium alkalisoli]|nr:hypothetical protein EKH55_2964 [Sinorhizobium alkalisoli]
MGAPINVMVFIFRLFLWFGSLEPVRIITECDDDKKMENCQSEGYSWQSDKLALAK